MEHEKLNILLVEDQETDVEAVRRAFQRNLEYPSFFVTSSIFEAKAYLVENSPNIVITDLYLPDGNGLELLSSKKNDCEYPLIVMSGQGDEKKAVEAIKAGAFDYLVKSDKSLAFIPTIVKMVLREWDTLQQKKLAEIKMIEAKEEAVRANEAKTDFLAKISHELRTPMNSILGFAQVLSMNFDEPLTVNQKNNVNYILKAGRHLLTLINELLDMSHVESGLVTISQKDVNVKILLDELVAIVKPLADEKNIKIFSKLTSDSDIYAWVDIKRLRQILLNLIGNAIKYNVMGGSITFECEKTSKNTICIQVQDTGIGISQDKIDDIFKSFCRLENESNIAEGTGIGLNIAKGLVELMDGSIRVESVLGEGSCFTIELPIKKKLEEKI